MGNRYQELSGDVAALSTAMDEALDKEEFRRLQAIFLRIHNDLTVEDIASITRFSESWIRQIHCLFRRGGTEAMRSKPKGGRRQERFTVDEEHKILASFKDDAAKGGILEVGKVHAKLEEECGRKIAKQTTYNILHRHGWRKIAPRPKHPEAEAEIQNDFKKNGLKLSLPRSKKLPN